MRLGARKYRLTTFTDLGLSEPILRALEAQGYKNPTPIQAKVVPAMMAERDVLGTSQTGTGKTAAFTLPIIHRLIGKGRPEPKTCRALILAPTRELAAQIEENEREIEQLAEEGAQLEAEQARKEEIGYLLTEASY